MKITWNTDVNAPCCPGEIVAEDGRTLLIQTDWDYPGTARTFGWDMIQVQDCQDRPDFDFRAECGVLRCDQCKSAFYPMEVEDAECPECEGHCHVRPFVPCEHNGTDGTVNCPDCGVTAGKFIQAASRFLNENDGLTVDDPGYFDAE